MKLQYDADNGFYGRKHDTLGPQFTAPYNFPMNCTFNFNEKFILFDFETTGFWDDAHPPLITEYCFLNMSTGEILYNTVNPKKAVATHASNITGLSLSNLIQAPTIDEEMKDILAFCANENGKTYLIAHNGKALDFKVFKREFFGKEPTTTTFEFVDSYRLMQKLKRIHSMLPTKISKKGKTKTVFNEVELIRHFDIFDTNLCHCAYYDVVGLFNVLTILFETDESLLLEISQYQDKKRKIEEVTFEDVKTKKCKCTKGDCSKCACSNNNLEFCDSSCNYSPTTCTRYRPKCCVCEANDKCITCGDCT